MEGIQILMFRKMKSMIGDFLVKGLSPSEIAFGISLGNFVGILPFLGLHTVMALGLAWLLRLNMGVVFLGTQISNPLSFPFILFISAQIGSVVLHGKFLDLSFSGNAMMLIKQYLYPTLIGSILLGLAVGTVTYPITLRFARRFRP
jgi:uncharacterized protein (DUF2062 family)